MNEVSNLFEEDIAAIASRRGQGPYRYIDNVGNCTSLVSAKDRIGARNIDHVAMINRVDAKHSERKNSQKQEHDEDSLCRRQYLTPENAKLVSVPSLISTLSPSPQKSQSVYR